MSVLVAPAKMRLFFALWPAPALQACLANIAHHLQKQLGGKATRQDSIHLTLVFLGDVEVGRCDEVAVVGDSLQCESFTLMLDTSGCWTHNRIAWVAPTSTPRAFSEMVGALQARVRDLGFQIDERPFAPHITLVRKARCTRLAPVSEPVQWAVDELVLMRSQLDAHGSRYSVIRRWPFRA